MSDYLTVTRLNQYIKSIVESDYSLMNITLLGEVSSLTKHYTGHFYFTLKDENSQIRCMMFSQYSSRLSFNLKNGDQILINGYVGVYDKGGTYQVYCRSISLYGEGQYLLMLSKLKEKLQKEGIFSKPKKAIPLIPHRIGLLTASTGAAVHDYINTINSRLKTDIYLFPCLVQGEDAPKSIIKALDNAINYDLDLIVITRGGGSKEDLRCFNDELLVRKIYELDIPLISAVGHQIDTTLIDYVSDKVCITPTDAANNSIAKKDDLALLIKQYETNIKMSITHKIEKISEKLMMIDRNIEAYSPRKKLKLLNNHIQSVSQNLDKLILNRLTYQLQKMDMLNKHLKQNIESNLKGRLQLLKILNNKLEYLNPNNLLSSGYAIIENNDQVITSTKDVKIDDVIKLKLSDGHIQARVIKIGEKK